MDIICQYTSNNTHFEVKIIVILAVNQILCPQILPDWLSCLSWKHSQVLLCWVNCHTRKIVNIMFPIYLNVHHFSIDIPLKCTSFVIILGQCSNHQRNNLEKNLREGENEIKGRKQSSDEARNYKIGFLWKITFNNNSSDTNFVPNGHFLGQIGDLTVTSTGCFWATPQRVQCTLSYLNGRINNNFQTEGYFWHPNDHLSLNV